VGGCGGGGASANEKKMVVLEEGYLRRGMLVNVE